MKSSFLARSRVILFCVIVFATVLLVKLFFIQVVRGSIYEEVALHQYATPSTNIYERGTIYFERKDGGLVSAATQISGFKVAVDAVKVIDGEFTFNELSKIITIDYDDFITKIEKKDDPYEEIAHRLSKIEADAISALKLSGISIYKEKWRFYPGINLASHTLGFVGYKGDELGGRYGLERQYDSELTRSTDNLYVNFFAEVFSNIQKNLFENEIGSF